MEKRDNRRLQGLSTVDARERLSRDGFNELPSARPKNFWRIAREVFREPMFSLLIACGTLYLILGDYREGIILYLTIQVIIAITFYQYRKTERALEALRKIASPRALVVRDGVTVRIAGREVVVDDLILLAEGDRVPADAILIDATNLCVDESLLTGESVPVNKDVDDQDGSSVHVYSGTLVVRGKGMAQVVATGKQTRFGRIGTSLEGIEQSGTRLQSEMKSLVRKLMLMGIFISLTVVLAFYLTRGGFLQSLLGGLAASMAIIPEEFPVVLTIFLALGSWKLSKENVLTRSPSAIESLGSATVLCSDKTGTITLNKMKVSSISVGEETVDAARFAEHRDVLNELATSLLLATPPDTSDPMEQAILMLREPLSLETEHVAMFVKEYPLSRELFAMTRVYRLQGRDGYFAAVKGAPEAVLKLCNFSPEDKARHLERVSSMAALGQRVLAVAYATLKEGQLPDTQHGIPMKFIGLVGLMDPVREEVPAAIRECAKAGIRVVLITGDYPVTAKAIGGRIGLPEGRLINGEQLNSMSDRQLQDEVRFISIFARVIPEQKLRIVEALKANREVVAMTGDGVNDAPALKAAHIGIAMGGKGTDVAREASSLVLLDDNFASIVSAIRSGRRIFDNLQKAMSYILAVHVPIIGLVLMPAFNTAWPILLMPLHIIFMELIIDPACTLAFEAEREEEGIMTRPPRDPEEPFFGFRSIFYSLLQGILLLSMVAGVYFFSILEGHPQDEVRTIAFSALILGNVFLILTNLSMTRNVVRILTGGNRQLVLILSVALSILTLILIVPALRELFNFSISAYSELLPALIGALLVLVVFEIMKTLGRRMSKPARSGRFIP